MIQTIPVGERQPLLESAGLPASAAKAFLEERESFVSVRGTAFMQDAETLGRICRAGRDLLARLPLRSRRNPGEKAAGHALVHLLADATWGFFGAYRRPIYDALTGVRSLRLDQLAWAGADLLPGILPTQADLAAESELLQMDKDGLEIQQGLFLAQLLSDARIGLDLCSAMLRPTAEALERLPQFQSTGSIDLGAARVEARGAAGHVTMHRPRYLNAEDDETAAAMEVACDLVLLHPGLRMGVLRGDAVRHPVHARVFSAGINLTRIYQGKLSYLFYLMRDMGFVNKIYRGLAPEPAAPVDEPEQTLEKPWLAVVDAFAIGGGCQLLLVTDYVIAEKGAYLSLPARKEGIIPGAANLRLPRFMGERLAREAIMFDKSYPVQAAEARALVNEVHARERLDRAADECVANALGSGMVSAAGNRKAIRVQAEPLDTFRSYMATYAYEQVFCHLSEQLVHNLERHWGAKNRRL